MLTYWLGVQTFIFLQPGTALFIPALVLFISEFSTNRTICFFKTMQYLTLLVNTGKSFRLFIIHSFIYSYSELLNLFQCRRGQSPFPGTDPGLSQGTHTLSQTLWGQFRDTNQPIVHAIRLWKSEHLGKTHTYTGREHKFHPERPPLQSNPRTEPRSSRCKMTAITREFMSFYAVSLQFPFSPGSSMTMSPCTKWAPWRHVSPRLERKVICTEHWPQSHRTPLRWIEVPIVRQTSSSDLSNALMDE